jgi:hypothetical protein
MLLVGALPVALISLALMMLTIWCSGPDRTHHYHSSYHNVAADVCTCLIWV